jgi:glycine cleavage system H protein
VATFHYTKTHEYIKEEGGEYFLGISTHAQKELGDITYVELPEVGSAFKAGESCLSVESVKAVAEVYAPLGLTITGANEALNDAPETINKDAEGAGWIVKIKLDDPAALATLMDAAAYESFDK